MNRLWTLACTALALTGAPVSAQESRESGSKDGGHAEPRQERPVDPRQEKVVRGWIKQLGSTEFKERGEAHDKLLGAGRDALPLLEAATKDSDDPEIRWQARKLTREITRGKAPKGEALRKADPVGEVPQVPQPPPGFQGRRAIIQPFGGQGLDERFEDLFQQLEREFGMRVPRGQFFDNDFFRDLERQVEDQNAPGFGRFQGQGHAFSMQIAPDKVRIEIKQKDADGKDKSEVYEAPDLKAFREKYPEIAKQYLHGVDGPGGLAFRFGTPLRVWSNTDPDGRFKVRRNGGARVLEPDTGTTPDQPLPQAPAAEEIPEGERLGVHIRAEIPAELREFLGLEENQGLQVVDVLDGSLGEALSLKAGDIVAEINGEKIVGTPVIRAALKGLGDDGVVRLTVFRKGEKLELKGKKGQRTK